MHKSRVLLPVVAGVCLVALYAAPVTRMNAADVRCMSSLTEGTYSTALVPYPLPHWECRSSAEGVIDMGPWP